MKEKVVTTPAKYSVKLLQANTDTLFVFGDNYSRIGKGGQAVVRDEPNCFGIATKWYPGYETGDYFNDSVECKNIIVEDIERLLEVGREYATIAFPINGIGTGLSNMRYWCPKNFVMMSRLLYEKFGFINHGFYADFIPWKS